ncbi:MAG: ATP-binding protein [Bryobacteraceae bacterium]|jgi:tRNA 2-thiocytidine biosynthesis protein TtcA
MSWVLALRLAAGVVRNAGCAPPYNKDLDIKRVILHRVGEAVTRYKMIREGDRVAVAFSGGKDSFTLIEALLALRERAPIDFTVRAFTIDQGKFLSPIEPWGDLLRARGVDWTYRVDEPSVRLMSERPGHGCDTCSRFRRRAVYEICRELGANVIALGHTADDFCEAFLRNAMFTGRVAALPPVTWSRKKEFRLIRPLVFVTEDLTTAYASASGAAVVPCGCSQKTGTVRRSIREIFAELEKDHPSLKQTLLTAMSNLTPSRLLDMRYLALEPGAGAETPEAPFPLLDAPGFTES